MKYSSKLTPRQTEQAIKTVRDSFEDALCAALNLSRVSAPMMVKPESGLNDDLNGVERPVQFDCLDGVENVTVVHSLAKWKRQALKRYNFAVGEGLYTDMNAIRRDEIMDNLHSIYVDQWDWEKVINKEMRNLDTLKTHVKNIVGCICDVKEKLTAQYPALTLPLNREVYFITSEELLQKYPDLPPKERENALCKEHGTVFVMQIGDLLSNGEKHDGRAPDYDDWALNGDLLFWYEPLNCALEISSMGIRVDSKSLYSQLQKANALNRLELPFHKALYNNELPLTIGGGIGQSRLCMLILEKKHIGEVQASVWNDRVYKNCEEEGIILL